MFFPFQNNPKYLDPSYKTDLDIWDCFGKGKTDLKAELHKINLDVWGHSRNGKALSYKQRNTVLYTFELLSQLRTERSLIL